MFQFLQAFARRLESFSKEELSGDINNHQNDSGFGYGCLGGK
jgi:hypothetical protein